MRPYILLLCFLLVGSVTTAQQELPDLRYIAERVVLIGIIENGEIAGNGSGTIVDSSGVIFTNRHVVEQADDLAIFILDDVQELPELRYYASVTQIADQIDFAVLQIDRDADGNSIDPDTLDLPFLPLETALVDIGEEVRVFGYPGIGDGYMVVTSGEVVTIQNGTVNGERVPVWYRTDTEFSGGNSGGLAVNNAGELVGIPTWVVTEDRTDGKLGGILPFTSVLALLENTEDFQQDEDTAPLTIDENPAPSGSVQDFTLSNQSDEPVCFVFISLTTAVEWGDDQLREEEIIMPGDQRNFEVTADYYDVLLLDCDGEELSDNRNVDITSNTTLTYGDGDDAPTTSGGFSVSCGADAFFDNGAEIAIDNVPVGVEYRITALGVLGFDPILAVFNGDADGICSDDSEIVATYNVNLPTTAGITEPSRGSQVTFTRESGDSESLSIVVGGYNNQPGEVVIIIEGGEITDDDGRGDLYSLALTQNILDDDFAVYMISEVSALDGFLQIVNRRGEVLDDNGIPLTCDDAGSDRCWSPIGVLSDSTVSTYNQQALRGGLLDPALFFDDSVLQAISTEREALNIRATSYNQESVGRYVMVFQLGVE